MIEDFWVDAVEEGESDQMPAAEGVAYRTFMVGVAGVLVEMLLSGEDAPVIVGVLLSGCPPVWQNERFRECEGLWR